MCEKPIEEIEYKGYVINIYVDDMDAESPREWEPISKMICFHGRYDLGDKHSFNSDQFDNWDEVGGFLMDFYNSAVILPLYLYDHSGLTINTTPFSCPWDSGQVGFILVPKENLLKEFGGKRMTKKLKEKALNIALGDVEVYDQYLRGEVYGYVVTKNGEDFDSCWGYYGYDFEISGLLDEAKSTIDYLCKEKKKEEA